MYRRLSMAVVGGGVLAVTLLSLFVFPDQAQAIPAFARKYNVNCTTCHTAPPILNHYGQRFLENGYQLPGTEDGGIIGKKKLGDLTLDDVTNYIGFRLVGNAVRNWGFKKENPAGLDGGVVENKTEFTFPENFVLFAGGTVTKNVGFMVELGHDVEEGGAAVERGFLTFSNLIGPHDLVHLRVGKFDPNTYSSYATVRQQLGDIGESVASTCAAFSPCALNRVGLAPSAFATKFSSSMGCMTDPATICHRSVRHCITRERRLASIFMGGRSGSGSSTKSVLLTAPMRPSVTPIRGKMSTG